MKILRISTSAAAPSMSKLSINLNQSHKGGPSISIKSIGHGHNDEKSALCLHYMNGNILPSGSVVHGVSKMKQ